MKEVEKIELRSEKVRHIIGEVPSSLVRYGILVITAVVIALLAASYFIPYPETVACEAVATDATTVSLSVPYQYVNEIRKGCPVRIEFEGYSADSYNDKAGKVVEVSRTPVRHAPGNRFRARASLDATGYKVYKGMTGEVYILVSNKTILRHIIGL